MPKFIIDGVNKSDYDSAGSKFITMTPAEKAAGIAYRDIEIGELAWDTPGKSMKLPVVVKEEGTDKGKETKISFGVDKDGIWKGKDIYRAITGKDMPFEGGHPAPDSDVLLGKKAVGMWKLTKGKKGGVGEEVEYTKLDSILPAGSKPSAKASL